MQTQVHGITLNYMARGQGPVVVLVHAFPLSGAMWQPQIEALASDYRVIAPDLRGFGASAVPEGPYAMETFAEDIAGLLDTLGIDQVVLGGLSMGGYVAFAFYRRFPERVRALILADTRAAADSAEAKAGREEHARLAEREGAGAIADMMLPRLLSTGAPVALRVRVRGIIEGNQPRGIAGALRGMALRPDATDLLPRISVPTLFLVGEEDMLTTPEVMQEMQAAVRGSRLARIPHAGHVANLENPEAFNTALRAFLAEL